MDCKHITVLGAGVIGLSSALMIKETWPDVAVTVVADTFSPHTTSDGSAGFWEPYALGETDQEWIRQTSSATYHHLLRLAQSSLAPKAGASMLSGYALYTTEHAPRDFFHDLVHGYRPVTEAELQYFPAAKSGYVFTSTQVDVTTYLAWMTEKFKALGGSFKRAKVNSLEELSSSCDVVINCVGIGARELLGDTKVEPISGQVIKICAPWVKHFYFLQHGAGTNIPEAYILPGTLEVTVGGTAGRGDWSMEATDDVTRGIWGKATHFLPMLTNAKILRQWKGLRPGRTSVRLEVEDYPTPTGALKVIHNYGHGGAGVTLHYGCALKVIDILAQLMGRSPNVKAKL